RAALEHDRDHTRRETASLHRIEQWRDRLIGEGDTALDEFMQQFPSLDRQHLRQLTRNARAERDGQKPLHAFHELFRTLRELLG
ncbi:MAG TPA: ribosome biogenesis factor YjgA, partial [Rudaea sp.]|nr:ribosome biogenesis factor YjgA [Rudaea sp.]